MFYYAVMFLFPLIVPSVLGGIIAFTRRSWTPLVVGVLVGVALEALFYFLILSQMVVQ